MMRWCGSAPPGASGARCATLSRAGAAAGSGGAAAGEGFARRGWTLYVTEPYGHSSPRARVMIPSALSGGSLSRRLEEAAERFGRER